MDTIAARVDHEIEPIKGSRFMATAAPIADEAAGHALVDELRARFPDATHHCWAWRIARPSIDRCHDDGEPSGSAGRPILAQLTGRDLTNTAVVVVRYFGGTKLGVGGLVRAYGSAAAETLDRCQIVEATSTSTLGIDADYSDAEAIKRVAATLGATVDDAAYGETVRLELSVDDRQLSDLIEAVANATHGRAHVDVG